MTVRAAARVQRGLIALSIASVAFAASCATSGNDDPAPTQARPLPTDAAVPVRNHAGSNRRVIEGCDPVEAAEQARALVGKRVTIQWAWKQMGAASADLRVPAAVLAVDPPEIVVTFDPNLRNVELFTSVWLTSGHITARPDGSFLVAPCSATIARSEG